MGTRTSADEKPADRPGGFSFDPVLLQVVELDSVAKRLLSIEEAHRSPPPLIGYKALGWDEVQLRHELPPLGVVA